MSLRPKTYGLSSRTKRGDRIRLKKLLKVAERRADTFGDFIYHLLLTKVRNSQREFSFDVGFVSKF